MFMNEYDIDTARRYAFGLPNRTRAVDVLDRLVDWTNRHSDGWAYWPKPCRAAKSLMTLIQSVDRFNPEDVTDGQVAKALVPIKAFLTRQGVDHALVLEGVDA